MAKFHNVRSRALRFPAGITYFPPGERALGFVVTEAAKSITVWQGLLPDETVDVTDLTQDVQYLPPNPADWTGPQTTHANTFMSAHGAEVSNTDDKIAFTYPHDGHTYVYVSSGTVDVTIALHGG